MSDQHKPRNYKVGRKYRLSGYLSLFTFNGFFGTPFLQHIDLPDVLSTPRIEHRISYKDEKDQIFSYFNHHPHAMLKAHPRFVAQQFTSLIELND